MATFWERIVEGAKGFYNILYGAVNPWSWRLYSQVYEPPESQESWKEQVATEQTIDPIKSIFNYVGSVLKDVFTGPLLVPILIVAGLLILIYMVKEK